MNPARLVEPLLRAFRWHRRWFAAILAGIAVLAALSALSPTSGTVPVVVASHQIAGGSTLAAADLQVLSMPSDTVAEGTFADPSGLVGGTVVVTVSARRPLTRADLLASGTLVGAGKVAVPVRFSDAETVDLLTVGSRIDVLGQRSADAEVTTVAAGVRVVAIPGSGGGGVLGSSRAGLVLVEADESQSAAILTATATGGLGYVLR